MRGVRLEARGLGFRYPGGGFELGPVDLDLGPGLWRLRGANGAGKTTLMRLLCGSLAPTSGEVRIGGVDPVRSRAARAQVAWLPPEPELPDFLEVGEAWRMLAALRGRPDWDGEPLRAMLDVPPRLRLGACSAGQRRKAELLAAAAGDPGVLLLDEPMANLDRETVARVSRWLVDLARERVVLVISHEPLEIEVDGEASLQVGAPLSWKPSA